MDAETFSDAFVTEIIGVTEFYSAFGTYNMSGMMLLSQPGVDIPVRLIVSSVDVTVPSVAEYLADELGTRITVPSDYQLSMSLDVRPCLLGEGLKRSGACFLCPYGTFLLIAPTLPTECKICPQEKAWCLGGK